MKVTSGLVVAALRKAYDDRSYAFLEQVRGGTGAQGSRYADGMAFGLFPSRGLDIQGFEVKVSRSDWLSELKQPAKADEIFQFCDYWWLAAGSDSIVKDGELPEPWGLMVLRDGEMHVSKQAPRLHPIAPSKAFIASIMRNLHKGRPGVEELEQQHRLGIEEGFKRGAVSAKSEETRDSAKLLEVNKMVAEFEEAAGLKIYEWNAGKVGAAVKALLNGANDLEAARERMRFMQRHASALADGLSKQIVAIDAELGASQQ